MSTFIQVRLVFATRETNLVFFCRIFCCLLGFLISGIWHPSYSKQWVVVERGWVGKASMPNQQKCNKYKDVLDSIIYLLKAFMHIIHV